MAPSRFQIRVATHVEPRVLEMDSLGKLSGLAIKMLQNLEFKSNYSFNISKPLIYEDVKSLHGTGDFFKTQVEQLVLSGEVDLAGSGYFFVAARAQNIHILLPTMTDKISAYFVQPHPIESNSLLTGPFTIQIQLLYLLMMILLILSCALILWTSNDRYDLKNSISDAALGVIACFCIQGGSMLGTSFTLRIVLITTSVLVYMIYSTYSAFLVSSLMSSIDPIRSFPALLSKEYTIYSSPSLNEYLRRERSVASFLIRMGSSLESFKKMIGGGHIHVAQDHLKIIDVHASALNMKSSEVTEKLSKVPFPFRICSGFYISKNSTSRLREPLNRRITRLGNTGLLHRYRTNFFRNSDSGFAKRRNEFLELKLVHVGKLFILWAGFSLVAVVLFIVELFYKKQLPHIRHKL